MAAQAWQMEQFERQMQKALERARIVLEETRRPCFASDVHHQYQDKFILAESMTNAALASHANCLALLGLKSEQLVQMCSWAKTSAVSLRFRSEEFCTYLREESRDVEDPTKQVVEGGIGGMVGKFTSKTVTKVTEYFWKYDVSYELSAVRGVGEKPEDIISIQKRSGQVELKTSSKRAPNPERSVPACLHEVNVSWMIKLLNAESDPVLPKFSIDRGHKGCHTPRRNQEVSDGMLLMSALSQFTTEVSGYMRKLLNVQTNPQKRLDLQAIEDDSIFIPVAPYLLQAEEQAVESIAAADVRVEMPQGLLACLAGSADAAGSTLAVKDVNSLLSEEARMLNEKHESLRKAFPTGDAIATVVEAIVYVTLRHCGSVCARWTQSVDYIEGMLRKQLIAAIGKEVMPADFSDYMRFHNRRLFADEYAPIPFCFAVRRSENHSPEGTLSIEELTDGGQGAV
jgi:hypothetical protein